MVANGQDGPQHRLRDKVRSVEMNLVSAAGCRDVERVGTEEIGARGGLIVRYGAAIRVREARSIAPLREAIEGRDLCWLLPPRIP